MGGAPPLPHDFAPEGVKNLHFLHIFGPRRQGAPRDPKTEVRRAAEWGPGLGPAGAPAEAWEDPGTPVLRAGTAPRSETLA